MSRALDALHLGRERVICVYDVDGVIVDPGPASCLPALAALEPRSILLTHIHLDHAGATGSLVRRHPDAVVYVHESGARHLADPSKLVASARRLYGDDLERLWGEVVPVPEENIRPVGGGDAVEGFRVAHTPGHASHHVCYLHEHSGEAFVGDMAGVRIPPSDYTLAPTVPPEFDPAAWLASLRLIAGWEPAALCLTHFGKADDPAAQLDRIRGWLERWTAAPPGDERSWYAALEEEIRAEAGPEMASTYLQAAPANTLYPGLARYWKQAA